jgi:acetate kinase
MSVNLLCINSGSSSLKFALYQLAEAEETSLADGMIERIGLPGSHLRMRTAATATALDEPGDVPDSATAVHAAFTALNKLRLPAPDAVGHRVVHGGAYQRGPDSRTPYAHPALHTLGEGGRKQ